MEENKNIDMFKLVQEVEKQKQKDQSTSRFDQQSVFSDLDDIINETAYSSQQPTLKKPDLPVLYSYESRFDAFKGFIEHVNYGTNNVSEYVAGHKSALNKYYKLAITNRYDLSITEMQLNDEISGNNQHDSLNAKGYYDGLFYLLKACKKSKELVMEKMAKELA